MAKPASPARVVRTGPPVAIVVKVAPAVCPSCKSNLFVGVCPKGCQRVARMDGPARTSPKDAMGARLQMAEIASRTVGR